MSSVPLRQALRHLQAAFANFFTKRAGYPTFRSRKKARASAEYTRSAFRFRDGALTLAKMDTPLDVVWSRPLPEGAQPSTVTVSRDAAGRWFVSLLVAEKITPSPPVEANVGIDAGITALATPSTGEKIANPRHERRDRRKLARVQRAQTREEKGSANRAKTRLTVARAHARIADRGRDQVIAVEDLTVRNRVKNRSLARAVSDASWRELRSMLEYKAQRYGRRLGPLVPVEQVVLGVRERVPLDVRVWECACGVVRDRDVNAARNVLAAGLAESGNACGAGVGPQRDSSRAGDRRRSRKTNRRRLASPGFIRGEEVKRFSLRVGRVAVRRLWGAARPRISGRRPRRRSPR
ncbi:RNA-guided endonuclease InsQ/TnpB family protein [Streptosporangium saharense]|uniref:RNA-guided endonuclease InsQ/TnpB family protein n=1 Tax=Streptosporangium saharense TaxID=1706840 RepID=UPI003EB9EC5F